MAESSNGSASVAQAIRDAASRLEGASGTPRLDAELLMAHALGCERPTMLLARIDEPVPEAFAALVSRRLAHEPIAYITGRRAFWTIELEVGPGVLVPRPESETLIEAALDHFGADGPATVLDLGTGSGALLLAALDQWPGAAGHGRDVSSAALEVAESNAGRLGLANRARFTQGDWADGVEGRFDLILCNPPYVGDGADLPPDVAEWEPAVALFAGPDGLAAYRRLAPEAARLLAPGGLACFEVGAGQAAAAGALFEGEGLRVTLRKDLAGHERCLVVRG